MEKTKSKKIMAKIGKILFSMVVMIMVIAFGSVFTSCTNDDEFPLDENKGNSVSLYSQDIQDIIDCIVGEYGFNPSEIRVGSEEIFAGGDIAFPIEGFWEKYGKKNTLTRTHYSRTNLISSNHRFIYLMTPNTGQSYALPTDWLTALVQAALAWNNLNGKISFTFYSLDNYTGTTVVGYMDYGANWDVVATAEFPDTSGNPGFRIRINSQYGGSTLTANQKTQVMIHELGHIIGMMHTDTIPSGTGYTVLSTGDNGGSDPNSVMQPYVLDTPTSPYFTQYDIDAYNLMYPWLNDIDLKKEFRMFIIRNFMLKIERWKKLFFW